MYSKLTADSRVTATSFCALFIAILALAFAPIFVRFCDAEPTAITFWRMAFAIPFLSLAWVFIPGPKRNKVSSTLLPPNSKAYTILILSGIAFALNLIVWNLGLNFTSIANATLFVNFAPLIIGLLTWVIFRKMLHFRLWLGMSIAIVGGFMLVCPHMNTENSTVFGDVLCLIAACFYGVYLLAVQKARAYFSTFAIMTLTSIVTGITAIIASFFLNETLLAESMKDWQALFALAIVVQVLGQSLVAYALAELPATLSSVVLLLQPVVAAIAAMIIFGEQLLIIQWAGMFIVLIGIGTTKFSRNT